MKILEWIKGVKVGTNGYELEEFEKPDGGSVREAIKSKVLWIGPLSITGQTETLNSGERFDNWDLIEVHFGFGSDTDLNSKSPYIIGSDFLSSLRAYSDTGVMIFGKVSETTFSLSSKTVSVGNIQRIVGIKL